MLGLLLSDENNKNKEELQKQSDLELMYTFQEALIKRATGGSLSDEEFRNFRTIVMSRKNIKNLLPDWLKLLRTSDQFWSYIQPKFAHYQERRNFINIELSPIFDLLEGLEKSPMDEIFQFQEDYINRDWEKALTRKTEDPEGAITSARSLLEGIMKHILDEQNIGYGKNEALSVMYKKVAELLNLAPEQHQESVFKQILGGANGIVSGLGELRNKLSDSHGSSGKRVRPKERHSELVVHLAGAMSIFIYKSYIEKYGS